MNILSLRKEQLEAARLIYEKIQQGHKGIHFKAPPRFGTSTIIETCIGAWRKPSDPLPVIIREDDIASILFAKKFSDNHAKHITPGSRLAGIHISLAVVDFTGGRHLYKLPDESFYDWFSTSLAMRMNPGASTLLFAYNPETPVEVLDRLIIPGDSVAFIEV